MREFAAPRTRLDALPLAAKVLYTSYCVLTLGGMISAALLYAQVAGMSAVATPRQLYDHIVVHYRGSTPDGLSPHDLLQVTHFHLFTMPVCLLVAGHLFALTPYRNRVKVAWIAAASGAVLVHLFAPVGVFLAGAALAWLYPVSGAVLLATFLVLLGAPVLCMWVRRGAV